MLHELKEAVKSVKGKSKGVIENDGYVLSPTEQLLAFYFSSNGLSDAVEARVVRQFVEALLFEALVPFSRSLRKVGGINNEIFEAIYDEFFDFTIGSLTIRCLGTVKAFNRIRVADGSIKIFSEEGYSPLTITDLVAALLMGDADKRRLLAELEQTKELCQWNVEHLNIGSKIRRNLSFQVLESAIHEGHLYHPCFKARTGFSLADHECYGPEAANSFQLCWLAISRDVLNQVLPFDESLFWRGELGEGAYGVLTQRLIDHGCTWQSYALMPIHPWQFKAILNKGLAQKIRQREIVDLGAVGDFYQASQSLRTLVNVSEPSKANVKLPMDVISTSSHRNLQQHFVYSAPVISQWLSDIVDNDIFLKSRNCLVLLKEYAGVLYEPIADLKKSSKSEKDEIHQAEYFQGRIGVIYRESVISKLAQGDSAVPFTALMLIEPDGEPFIIDWIERYGAESWVDRLLDVMLIPIWHLLVNQGIAFESHAQNLILIHRDGWPEKIVMRDFHEETEYVPDFLADPKCQPELSAVDSYFAEIPDDDGYRMASTDSLLELFMDTVFIYNLSELSFLLERSKCYSENKFWSRVKRSLDQYEKLGITDQQRINRIDAFRSELMVESLLTKKIKNGGALEYYFHSIPNRISSRFKDKG